MIPKVVGVDGLVVSDHLLEFVGDERNILIN
jgi:hypothetical protein